MKLGKRSDVSAGQLGAVLAAGALGVSLGCGKKATDETVATVLPYSGMAIGTVAEYTSSTLHYQAMKDGSPTGDLRTLLTGESGDPWIFSLNDKIYFFNRTTTSSNFRTIDPAKADGAPSAQIRTEGAGYGDPHDALWLSNDRVLLAHYSAGKLVVINPNDGSIKQEVTATWDLGSDALAVFRPEAFYRVDNSTSGEIYVLNQGRKSDFTVGDSQQIFVLKDDGTTVTVVDVDTTKDKVQGIKLKVVNPQIIVGFDDPSKPIVAGFCTTLDSASPCASGVEKVDLAARTSTLVIDMSNGPEKGNGSIVAAKNGKLYAALATADTNGGYKSFIQAIDVKAASSASLYQLSDPDYASYAIGYDMSADKLYVGEKNSDGKGQLSVFDFAKDSTKPSSTLALPLPPYFIKFVR